MNAQFPKAPELLVTVGLPRIGKSTWAKKQNCPIVNPDSIRMGLHGMRFVSLAEPMVWAIAQIMVRALFHAGHEKVVLDSTANTLERRAQWVHPREWFTKFISFPLDREICIARAMDAMDFEIIPVIERMWLNHEPPRREEGSQVVSVDSEGNVLP